MANVYRVDSGSAPTSIHYLTLDYDEYKGWIGAGWIDFGIVGRVAIQSTGAFTTPLYRLYKGYSPASYDWFYTTDVSTANSMAASGYTFSPAPVGSQLVPLGWVASATTIANAASDLWPLYQFLFPGTNNSPATPVHTFTTSYAEQKNLAATNSGYTNQNTATYLAPPILVNLYRTDSDTSAGATRYLTASEKEYVDFNSQGWVDRGIAGTIASQAAGELLSPMYRLYSPTTFNWIYTMNDSEASSLVANNGYLLLPAKSNNALVPFGWATQQAPPANTATDLWPLYRLRNSALGRHTFTTSLGEYNRRTIPVPGTGAELVSDGPIAAYIGVPPNPTARENSLPGDPTWFMDLPHIEQIKASVQTLVEGFAAKTSINRGEGLDLYINTNRPECLVTIYRLGWYGGVGARAVGPVWTSNGIQMTGHYNLTANVQGGSLLQPIPTVGAYGEIDCLAGSNPWQPSYHVSASDTSSWCSGCYVVRLEVSKPTDPHPDPTQPLLNMFAYVPFVLRDDARRSDILAQSSATTQEAYSDWPGTFRQGTYLDWPYGTSTIQNSGLAGQSGAYPQGQSFYTPDYSRNNLSARAQMVSFNRPHSPDNFETNSIFSWELAMIHFLESENRDVAYCTNLDVHQTLPAPITGNPTLFAGHKAFLSVGHDEYWTSEMRANVTRARDANMVHIGFFSANNCNWRIRLSNNNRTMACFKCDESPAVYDPSAVDASDPACNLVTGLWRWRYYANNSATGLVFGWAYPGTTVRTPADEDELTGVETTAPILSGYARDMAFLAVDRWPCWGTGLATGAPVGNKLVGYEIDELQHMWPSQHWISSNLSQIPIAHTAVAAGIYCDMVVYSATSPNADPAANAIVFATGSMSWCWGLDNIYSPGYQNPAPYRNSYNTDISDQENYHPDFHFVAGTQVPKPPEPIKTHVPPSDSARQITRNVLDRFSGRWPELV
jgi:hypothetical protein